MKLGIGDVLLTNTDQSGVITSTNAYLPLQKDIQDCRVGFIQNSGTCFMIAQLDCKYYLQNERIIGLALTASHCLMNYTKQLYGKKVSFDQNLSGAKYLYTLIPLKFYSDSRKQMRSGNGQMFVLPDDIALCAILVKANFQIQNQLLLPIAKQKEHKREQIGRLLGYPCISQNLDYNAPSLQYLDGAEKYRIIWEAFHGGDMLLKTEGRILNNPNPNQTIDIECSAITGMSGSPLLIDNNGLTKVLGVYSGGSPAYGQQKLFQIAEIIESGKIKKALRIIQQCIYTETQLSKFAEALELVQDELLCKRHRMAVDACFYYINQLAIDKQGIDNYNCAIPLYKKKFDQIRIAQKKFMNYRKIKRFKDIQEFTSFLLKFQEHPIKRPIRQRIQKGVNNPITRKKSKKQLIKHKKKDLQGKQN